MVVDYNKKYVTDLLEKDIIIWDETLRDGEQSPGVAFSLEQKVEIAKLLDEMGISIIDIGFPTVSNEEQDTIKYISKLGLNSKTGVTIRAKKDDVDCAVNCGVSTVFIFAPTSKIHIKYKFGLDYDSVREMVLGTITYALEKGLEVYFIAEDTSRSEMEFIVPLFNEICECGVNNIIITDTVGVMLPTTIKQFVSVLIKECNPNIRFGIHCHNDFGLATANTLAAIEAGVVIPTLTVNAIGERAGNASFEETVLTLEKLYGYHTGIDLKKIHQLSRLVEKFSGLPVSPNKPIVGYNVFRHESGIHVHSLLKLLETYEPFSPEVVGGKREFVFGKHTGRALIRHTIKENGLENESLVDSIFEMLKMSYKDRNIDFDVFESLYRYYDEHLGLTEDGLLNMINSVNNELKETVTSK